MTGKPGGALSSIPGLAHSRLHSHSEDEFVCSGPLTADLAALETWLAFELPPEDRREDYENTEWRNVIDRLYGPSSFLHPPEPSDPTSSYCWMISIVRQIRHLGLAVQFCPTEYESAVAVSLLRRCMGMMDVPPTDSVGHTVNRRPTLAPPQLSTN